MLRLLTSAIRQPPPGLPGGGFFLQPQGRLLGDRPALRLVMSKTNGYSSHPDFPARRRHVTGFNAFLKKERDDGFLVHAILGIRTKPNLSGGWADSQDRMDQE